MAVSDDFLEYIEDQLSELHITRRKMFGGAGLYRDGKIFGLVADDTVYFKVDDSNRMKYLDSGSSKFKPFPDKEMYMSYYDVPPEVLEDSAEFSSWALLSLKIPSSKKRKKK